MKQKASLSDGSFFVEGTAAIREYIKFRPQALKRIFYKPSFAKHFLEEIPHPPCPTLVSEEPRATPCWADVQLKTIGFEEMKRDSFIVALDHITDPRNLGAIVRTCAFFGIKSVIVPKDRQVLLTGASVATAQGGFALTDLVEVTNLNRTLELLKKEDYWILAADMDGRDSFEKMKSLSKKILVMGSEESGLSDTTMKLCDGVLSIPGAEQRVESLNVSVAAGILIANLV